MSIDIQEQSVSIQCRNAVVELRFITEEIVRITLYPQSEKSTTRSFAVSGGRKQSVDFQMSESNEAFTLRSKKLKIVVEKRPCRIAIYDSTGELIIKDHHSFGMCWRGTRKTCWKELHDEPFYGLGGKTGEFNKRGKTFTMWNSDTPGYTLTQDPLYQTHPFFLSIHQNIGFGIFLDNSYRTNFNFGAGTDRFYSFEVEDGILDYYFIYGPELKDVIARYALLVGKLPLPPRWSLGYQQSRWSYSTDRDLIAIANKFRNRKIPCDTLYLDIDYMDGYRCFTWHPENFAHPKKMIRELHEMGFKIVTIIDPGIKVDETYSIYQEGLEGDHFSKYPDGSVYQGQVWPDWCCFPDFSRKRTRKWWGKLYKKLIDVGVDGFWNDMNEPTTWGGTFPDIVEFDDEGEKSDHLKIHNLYGALMAQATHEGLMSLRKNERPFLLTRAGYAGVYRYAAMWTGDNVSSWEHLRLAVRMCLGLSMSGYAFCGSDIGGFMGAPTAELYSRWLQFGIFCPLCRTHTAINTPEQEPWSYGEEFESINRKIIELRYRLLPYLYYEFYTASKTGLPIMRPMLLEVASTKKIEAMDDQYLFGNDLLVAPVLQENIRCRGVYLPPGEWYDYWTDERITGDREIIMNAPLDQIPLFVRAGAIIPMQDVTNYVDEKEPEYLYLHLYPCDGSSVRSIYEDDGISFKYLNQEYNLITIEMKQFDGCIELNSKYTHTAYRKKNRKFELIFHGISTRPEVVTVEGRLVKISDSEHIVQADGFFDKRSQCLNLTLNHDKDQMYVQIVF
ncbi:DUF4968 domain-containing protein [candidate division KSB1 bacterium]|nr:DUF4968 domain-containing protein [candidate division KSB1 bacterium]